MNPDDDVRAMLEGLSSVDPRERVNTLHVLSEDPTGSPEVMAKVRELMADRNLTSLTLPYTGEVRFAAAPALAAEQRVASVMEPVVLADVPTPLASHEMVGLGDRAGIRSVIENLDAEETYTELRRRGLIPLVTVRLDPADRTGRRPDPPVGETADALVELVGRMLDFADSARASMCAEFGVRYIAEVAGLARLRRVERNGWCRDGRRYFIHGNGYDVYATETAYLTMQASGYAHVERIGQLDETAGLYDYVDLYALRDFSRAWASTAPEIDALAEACAEFCRRGVLHDAGGLRYQLIPTPERPAA